MPSTVTVTTQAQLTAAVAGAAAGDIISIANDITLTAPLRISKNLTFQSSGSDHWTLFAPQSRHFVGSVGVSLTFTELTLDGQETGGGIETIAADAVTVCLTMTDCTVQNCYSDKGGTPSAGGILSSNTYGSVVLTRCQILNNKVTNGVGGIRIGEGNSTITDCTIKGNISEQLSGGIDSSGSLTIFNSDIIENIAEQNGGGIHSAGPLSITGGRISNNKAIIFGAGGGIMGSNEDVTLNAVEVSGNTCGNSGAGIYTFKALNISGGCKIINNISIQPSAAYGGAIATNNLEALNIAADTEFSGNLADNLFIPSADVAAMYPLIRFKSTSITSHILNNYDVRYSGETEPITAFNITYMANDGTETSYVGEGIKPLREGVILTQTETAITRANYRFTGWNTNAAGNGTAYQGGDPIVLRDNLTLYAQWEIDAYAVTFEANNGGPAAVRMADAGAVISKPIDPVRPDYRFEGWYKDNGTFRDPWDFAADIVTQAVTLYAKWIELPMASLTLRADAKTVQTGNTLTYTITFANAHTESLSGAYLTDALPVSLESPAYTLDGAVWQSWSGSLGLGTVAGGSAAEVLLRGIVAENTAGIIRNTATVSFVPFNQPSRSMSASVTVTVIGPRDQAVSDIIESVALQEAALARILNAEGEKIQAMVAMEDVSFEELIQLNESATQLLSSISRLEMMLQNKLDLFANDCDCS